MTRLIAVPVVLLGAVGGGWLWGASGRRSGERAQQVLELRQDLVEGRSALLDARLNLFGANVDQASGHLENARSLLRRADQRLMDLGWDDEVAQVEAVLAGIEEAQRLADRLGRTENSRAGQAATVAENVPDKVAKP